MDYKLGYSGPEVDKYFQKSHESSIVSNGWVKLESSELNPVELNLITDPKCYQISFWNNGPAQLTTNGPINLCVSKNLDTGELYQVIYYNGHVYTRSTSGQYFINTWIEEQTSSNPDISDSTPKNPSDNYIWIDMSTGAPIIRIYNKTLNKWISVKPKDMANKSIYDSENKNQSFTSFLDEKIKEADLANAETVYKDHLNAVDNGLPIHLTAEEKLQWSNGANTDDYTNELTILTTEVKKYADTVFTDQINTVESYRKNVNVDRNTLNAHMNDKTVHLTSEQVNTFTNKSDWPHTHHLDNRVTVSTINLEGVLDIDKIDPSVIERCYEVNTEEEMLTLRLNQVQNGDTIYIHTEYPSAWFVVNDKLLGTMDAFVRYSRIPPEPTWDNIIGRPTNIKDYGIDNVYTKEEIDALYRQIMDSLNKSKKNAETGKEQVSMTIPGNLQEDFDNKLQQALELNAKVDELLNRVYNSSGYSDEDINKIRDIYEDPSIIYKPGKGPSGKEVNVNYLFRIMNSQSFPVAVTPPESVSYDLDYISEEMAVHRVRDEEFPEGMIVNSEDDTGFYKFGGWEIPNQK